MSGLNPVIPLSQFKHADHLTYLFHKLTIKWKNRLKKPAIAPVWFWKWALTQKLDWKQYIIKSKYSLVTLTQIIFMWFKHAIIILQISEKNEITSATIWKSNLELHNIKVLGDLCLMNALKTNLLWYKTKFFTFLTTQQQKHKGWPKRWMHTHWLNSYHLYLAVVRSIPVSQM